MSRHELNSGQRTGDRERQDVFKAKHSLISLQTSFPIIPSRTSFSFSDFV
jgi:hypothetical protein